MNATIEQLLAHRSIRAFTNQPLPQPLLEQLIRAGQAAATSSFIQACSVIQIDDQTLRQQLAQCAGNQAYVASAPRFLVFCADMQRHKKACQQHQADMLSGFTEQLITATVDCALFAQNVVVAAESLGLGTVYIGGLRNDIDKVTQLLELPELVYPVFGLCLGYPDQQPALRPRLPLPVVLKQDRYSDTQDAHWMKEYDAKVSAYYQQRSNGKYATSWSEQIAGMLAKEARPHMLAYLQKQGFLLK